MAMGMFEKDEKVILVDEGHEVELVIVGHEQGSPALPL